jgi:RimJ/RimL family protein N-acetyltransferase
MNILETKRLTLRHYTESDAKFIKRLLNEPSFITNIGDRKIETLDDARAYISARLITSYEKNGFGLYMVELKSSKIPIGMCGLVKRDPSEDPDIGFAFVPEAWRKGYAEESSLGVLNYAKNKLKLKRILGITIPTNVGSIKTLEKIGLKFEKISTSKDDGKEIRVYSITL